MSAGQGKQRGGQRGDRAPAPGLALLGSCCKARLFRERRNCGFFQHLPSGIDIPRSISRPLKLQPSVVWEKERHPRLSPASSSLNPLPKAGAARAAPFRHLCFPLQENSINYKLASLNPVIPKNWTPAGMEALPGGPQFVSAQRGLPEPPATLISIA